MHEYVSPLAHTVPEDMAREFRVAVPFGLEADRSCAVRPALRCVDCHLRREIRPESVVLPFCGGVFLDQSVGVGAASGWEGFRGSKGVFGCSVVALDS